jgi:flagellin
METDDADLIELLNTLAVDNAGLTKNSDGNYTLAGIGSASSALLHFGGSKVDISNLKFSEVDVTTAGGIQESILLVTDDAVTVTKESGADDNPISLDSIEMTFTAANAYSTGTKTDTLSGSGSTNADGISFVSTAAGSALMIEEGTATVKVDDSDGALAKATIGINTVADSTVTTLADASFTMTAKDVSYVTMNSAAGVASVVLSTDDTETASTLSEMSKTNKFLTQIDENSFTFTSTAGGADATLDFGSQKVDLDNLTFAGVANGEEKIYVRTQDTVTVTKNGEANDVDVSLASYNDTTKSTLANMVGVKTDAASSVGSLAGLKGLSEGGLTADIANEYMSNVDEAINQINAVRSDFGSTQNQLDVAIRSMMVTEVNIKAAESVIRDVDYAKESATFNKQNIIAQAGTYAMSQANAMAQNVQRLLQ